jgi:hypothetical protein
LLRCNDFVVNPDGAMILTPTFGEHEDLWGNRAANGAFRKSPKRVAAERYKSDNYCPNGMTQTPSLKATDSGINQTLAGAVNYGGGWRGQTKGALVDSRLLDQSPNLQRRRLASHHLIVADPGPSQRLFLDRIARGRRIPIVRPALVCDGVPRPALICSDFTCLICGRASGVPVWGRQDRGLRARR